MTIKRFDQTTPGKNIELIYDLFKVNKPLYDRSSEEGKRILLTILDDVFWVGTNVKLFWTGLISEEAKSTGQKCQQHRFPRLLATKMMFDDLPDTIEEFQEKYIKFCEFDYTTSSENKKLIPFQKEGVFETPEIAYDKAGIVFSNLQSVPVV